MNVSIFLMILQQVVPAVLYALPATRPIAALIANAMQTVMGLPGATGPERKAAALELIEDGITAMNIQAGREILNVAKTMAAASVGIELAYAVAKMIHDAHQKPAPVI